MNINQLDSKQLLTLYLESCLKLNDDIKNELKRLKKEGGHDERKYKHTVIRMLQEWFRLNGRIPV